MNILVCAFKATSPRPLSYRKYTTHAGAITAIAVIFRQGEADYISVRIVKGEECPSPNTAKIARHQSS